MGTMFCVQPQHNNLYKIISDGGTQQWNGNSLIAHKGIVNALSLLQSHELGCRQHTIKGSDVLELMCDEVGFGVTFRLNKNLTFLRRQCSNILSTWKTNSCNC